jgi:uncharacterized protein (DUF927 family)
MSGFTVSSKPPVGSAAGKPDADGAIYPDGFEMRTRGKKPGLWYQPSERPNGEVPDPVWVAAPFKVLAETNDDTDNSHGLLLDWTSSSGQPHHWAMPQRMVHADGNSIASELQDAGLRCGTSRAAHEQLKNFLGAVQSTHRVRCVEHTGWHGADYVMPNGRVFGAAAGAKLVLQSQHIATAGMYDVRGTLREWQDNVAKFAVGNRLMLLTISAAFAGPLLEVLGEASGGIHLFGQSQTGKTTLICICASVSGPGEPKTGPIRSWRTSANGLEAVACEHNDGILLLDEIGQVVPVVVGTTVYMLANGQGKTRMKAAGGARQLLTWRLIFLSTGEIPLVAKMAEAGLRPHAGQEVRLLNLSADAGAGFGVFQNLYGAKSIREFAGRLRDAALAYFGTAGPAFLDALTSARAKDPGELSDQVRDGREKFLTKNVSGNVDEQVRSAAARFALIGLAGELARSYAVVPWPEGDALRAAEECFEAWVAGRGGDKAKAAEDVQAIELAKTFIARHGASRFEHLPLPKPDEGLPERVVDRAGYVQGSSGGQRFLILPPVWRNEVFKAMDPSRAARALKDAGFLVPDPNGGHFSQTVRIPGRGPTRVYVISGTILEGADE